MTNEAIAVEPTRIIEDIKVKIIITMTLFISVLSISGTVWGAETTQMLTQDEILKKETYANLSWEKQCEDTWDPRKKETVNECKWERKRLCREKLSAFDEGQDVYVYKFVENYEYRRDAPLVNNEEVGWYCYDYPESGIIFYKKIGAKFREFDNVKSYKGILEIDDHFKVDGINVFSITNEISGTGHYFETYWYILTDNGLQSITNDDMKPPEFDGVNFTYTGIRYREDENLEFFACVYKNRVGCFRHDVELVHKNDQWSMQKVAGTEKRLLTSRSNVNNRRGLELYKAGRYEQAIAEFEQAVYFDESNFETLGNLGLAQLKAGNLQAAAKYFRQVLNSSAADSLRAGAAYNLGMASEELNELDEALVAYEKAVEIKPTTARKEAVQRLSELLK